ncbi:hypothetical protein [Lyngbya confervoides]|uniref:Uncharacterized protein n=1 Tax=Lyngbya confervoides BDU141951 TaxID=1574623 RepID=A0ABD4T0A2_9CYAN|nr:hypothetical protein [Lyngbya confervoides]MCM1981790.1 hypothetical protein [Lyngbya confervoides BDU141951]
MTEAERLKKLMALLTIALSWSVLMGQVQVNAEPLKLKKHGRPEKSLFRCGFDTLRQIFLNSSTVTYKLREALELLRCVCNQDSTKVPEVLSCT